MVRPLISFALNSIAPWLLLLLLCTTATMVTSQNTFPKPTGPYDVIGVHDFEFVDTTYPSTREEDDVNDGGGGGRRIMVRVWYPACRGSNFDTETRVCVNENLEAAVAATTSTTSSTASESSSLSSSSSFSLPEPFGPRKYLWDGSEREAIGDRQIEAFSFAFDLTPIYDASNDQLTNSYWDASVVTPELERPLPIVVFNCGALGHVGQNTALMEDLASHGYAVFSVSHPGGSYILYPNGDTLPVDEDFLSAVFGGAPPVGLNDPDINVRYEAKRNIVESNNGTNPYLPRWRDDILAFVDYLEEFANNADDALPPSATELTGSILRDILGKEKQLKVVYGGMSFGASAAGSAAQIDERAVGVFNLDEAHKSPDLLGTAVRTPYLNIFAGGPVYSNEFFFEPLTTMGSDPNVYRIAVKDSVHLEFTDIMFVPNELRMVFGGGNVNATEVIDPNTNAVGGLHYLIASSVGEFLDMAFGGHDSEWDAESVISAYPEKSSLLDVSYVAEWARTSFDSEDASSSVQQMLNFVWCLGAVLAIMNM